ncbi:MAG TPA: DUF3857 domain-containing protein, partial [candidate division WOR-3 bacterium]|nr:DUF3857 domain-containing protein [candidate division WOR-3 bacterium]
MKRVFVVLGIVLILVGCAGTKTIKLPENITRDNFPNANAVVVFDSSVVDVQPDGKFLSREHAIIKILTMKGKAEYADQTFSYYTMYDTVRVIRARVIKEDGKIIDVPRENIKDVKIPAMSKFFLPNVRMKKITFPDVEIGDAIEYIVEDEMRAPPMENNYDAMVMFQGTDPILHQVYVLKIPMDVKWKVYNDEDGMVKYTNKNEKGKSVHIWEIKDVPGIIREPLMPAITDVAKKILISTVPSWKVWSKWYWGLCKDKFAVNDTMIAVMDSLLKGTKTKMDTIRAIYHYVADEVRYVGTTMSGKKGGYEPFPATKTFRQKYGVCRDKAALMVAMLRHLGIEAYTVLTNPAMKVEKEIPVDQFNHAIVAIKEGDWYIFSDPTVQFCKDLLAPYEQNRGVLVCTPEGEDLAYTEILPPDSNTSNVTAIFNLNEDGGFEAEINIVGKGMNDMGLRMLAKMLSPDRIKQIFEGSFQSMGSGVAIDTIIFSDPQDYTKPVNIKIKLSADEFALVQGKKMRFTSPFSGGSSVGISVGRGGGGDPFALEKRNYPLYLYSKSKSIAVERIKIPKGYRVVQIPEDYTIDSDFMTVKSTWKRKVRSIEHKTEFIMKKIEIMPEEYPSARKAMKEMQE